MSGISRVVSSSPIEDEIYLTRPKACRKRNIGSFELPEKLHRSKITTNGFKNVDGDEDVSDHLQFWSPSKVGRSNLLTTVDKPFWLGQHNQGLCLITSSKDLDSASEVQEVHQALKVNYKKHELDEIIKLLKDVCNTHKLPLAQTWTVSSGSSFVATKRNIEMTCNSFNTRWTGKVCMSTTGLPFYVKNLCFWHFREACRKHQLLKSKGFIGRALSSHGSCICFDVTKLRDDEYSLAHIAHFGISDVVLLLVRVKRWLCLSNHHGFSAKWWICSKHNSKSVCKSKPSAHKRETICGPHAHSGVYHSSPKKNKASNASDKRMVTVKATFKDDMIKFIFPLSSGLSELKKQVAQRFQLDATRLCLNYKDEDDDLILISCDADLRSLMPFSASPVVKKTIKLIVQMVKD